MRRPRQFARLAYRKRPRPVLAVRRWRWRRSERRSQEALRGYRIPVQVCPRGCEFHELARRDLMAQTRPSGRASVHVDFTFETENCPLCGVALLSECARCGHDFFAPVVDRCQFCGLPQPWALERRGGAERANIRAWKTPELAGSGQLAANDPAIELYKASGRGRLWVIDGNIAELDVDAVVSNDDVDGRMWSQVARAIKNGAGPGVERLAQEGRPFKLGQAWWTDPGQLTQMKGIVHVASMSRLGDSHLTVVSECLEAAFKTAEKKQCRSLAVAAFGSSPATNIDPSSWYEEFSKVAIQHLDNRADSSGDRMLDIILALFETENFANEVETVREAVFSAWEEKKRPKSGRPACEPVEEGRIRKRKIWKEMQDS